jgi:D-glycero-D-manno-heptose 1,7-bisphosphate phosphatase
MNKNHLRRPSYDRSLILDRDGTLNFDNGYSHLAEELNLIPIAIEVLQFASSKGFNFFVASNQGGLALEKFSLIQMNSFNAELNQQLLKRGIFLNAIYCCTHHPDSKILSLRSCHCRKPQPGLYEALIEDYGLNPSATTVVGNSINDIQPSNVMNLKSFLVENQDNWAKLRDWIAIQ